MCGIAGIFSYFYSGRPVEDAELICMRDAMLSRGPDGAGLWTSSDRRVGIVHRRLSIIDLSEAGAQPMSTPDNALQIVFNGEIYNYLELKAELEKKGCLFRSHSDTEVLLHLYSQYGMRMVDHLRGMYALAIWDDKRKGLFLARDPFGIKPLYYSDDGKTFKFASQVKALLKAGGIDTSPEPAGHVGFYLWGHVPEPYTLYRGIHSIAAGSSMWIGESGKREKLTFFDLAGEIRHACSTHSEIAPKARKILLHDAISDSIKHHMLADVPVGLFLSAGLDSATLVAHASRLHQDGLHTLTLGFEEYRGTPDDETILAEGIAKHYGTKHQTKWVRREDFRQNFDALLNAMDLPTVDGVNTYFVSKVAAEAGMKVALSGVGGDELFGGYPSFTDVPEMVGKFGRFARYPAVGKAFRWVAAPVLKHFTSPKYAGLLEYGGSYAGAYMLRRGLFMPWELPDILDGEMVRDGWNELGTMNRLEETAHGVKDGYLKVMALETTWYMGSRLLRDADWAGMAHSLEIRTPFVDIGFFRETLPLLASGTPPTKLDMAATPEKKLPSNILDRPKTGFSVPVRQWLQDGRGDPGRGLRPWAIALMRRIS